MHSIAFRGEPERDSLTGITANVSPVLQSFDLAQLHVSRLVESVGDLELRTDFVDFPHPTDANAALLIYSVRVHGATKLVTMFPISAASRAKYSGARTGDNQPITTQYNAWIDGLTGTSKPGTRHLQ